MAGGVATDVTLDAEAVQGFIEGTRGRAELDAGVA
jgi:hypothetical protein